MVPNPYTVLSEIPERAKYFSVINLKDAFYSVPLAEESQFLFFFFFFFNFIFKLYIIVLVLPNIKMNPPQVYMFSPS